MISGMTSKIIKRDRIQIKTPQALIHIRHKISLLQYKYWILMLQELRRQTDSGIPCDEKGFRSIPMSVIAEALGYTPNKSQLWNDMLGLKNETIAYNFLSKDGGEEKYGAGFISEWKVHSSRIEFKFPSFIEDVVKGLDEPRAIFQSLNWEIFNHFSGKYEAIIYKLCRDYRGVKRTPYFDLARFRDYMGLEITEYKEFRDLNKVVISTPVKTINASEASDILVEVEFERQGRKVVGLRFLIEPKTQSAIPFPELESSEAFRFAKVHIEPAAQQKYLGLRTEPEIEACIERANEYGDKEASKGKEPNYGALYRTAITEGWHVQKIEQKNKKMKEEKQRQVTQEAVLAAKLEQAAKSKQASERISETLALFSQIPETTQDDIREQFRATLTAIPIRKIFDKQGESAAMIRGMFCDFVLALNLPTLKAGKEKAPKAAD